MKKPNRYLVILRNKYYYQRRVPGRFKHLDSRERPRVSLKTANVELARARRDLLEEADEQWWYTLAARAAEAYTRGEMSAAEREAVRSRYDAAVTRAMAYGFAYKTAEDIADTESTRALLDRISILEQQLSNTKSDGPKQRDIEALLGAAPDPSECVTVSEAFKIFVEKIAFDDQYNKSEAQRYSWEKTKRTSINYFIDQMGDMAVNDITRDVAIDYQDWWKDRMDPEDGSDPVTPNTANRHIGNVRSLLQRYFEHVGVTNYDDPFRKMYFSGKTVEKKRLPFEDDWVRSKILAPGLFDGLNDELRVMIFVLIETGARLSEICGLRPEDIRLNHKVPHLHIRPEQKRELKTKTSARDIPLVGAARIAMMAAPEGFPRYYDKSGTASANLMKAFRQRKLLPTDQHKIYSFRHSFEDRMLHAGLDYGLRCALMGHNNTRPEYGMGGSLEYRQDELNKIAHPFDPALFQGAPLNVNAAA
ncbi:MAG: tyrosine-type recombinase/integrase [Pseudomonadota bacterium]